MLKRLQSDRGITIIETTVVLSVMFILAGALSPIVSESITTARAVRAKNDASMIAMALINLQKDVGADAGNLGTSGLAHALNLPEVLMSLGTAPSTEDPEAPSEGPEPLAILARPGGGKGRRPDRPQHRKWLEAQSDLIDDHFVTNRKGYRLRRPGEYGGWNGPYISTRIKGDPWGSRYLVNTSGLDGGTSAADSSGQARRAVFVVSAGANAAIETPFDQPITDAQAFGDDIVVRIQ